MIIRNGSLLFLISIPLFLSGMDDGSSSFIKEFQKHVERMQSRSQQVQKPYRDPLASALRQHAAGDGRINPRSETASYPGQVRDGNLHNRNATRTLELEMEDTFDASGRFPFEYTAPGQPYLTFQQARPRTQVPLPNALTHTLSFQAEPFEDTLKLSDTIQKSLPISIRLIETMPEFACNLQASAKQSGQPAIENIIICNQKAQNFVIHAQALFDQMPANCIQTLHPAVLELLINRQEQLLRDLKPCFDGGYGSRVDVQTVQSWHEFKMAPLKSRLARMVDMVENPSRYPSDEYITHMAISQFETATVKDIMRSSNGRVNCLKRDNQLYEPLSELRVYKLQIAANMETLERAARANIHNSALQKDVKVAMWDLKIQQAFVVNKLAGEEKYCSAEKWLQTEYAAAPHEQRLEVKKSLEADLKKALQTLSHWGLSDIDKSLAVR